MEFAIISPTAGLEKFSRLSRTHLVLPQVTNQLYETFYYTRRREGDTLILDNGAYESTMDIRRLEDSMRFYMPQITVCPDHLLDDWRRTMEATQVFLEKWYGRVETEFMGVPQAKAGDLGGWYMCLAEMLRDPRITWIGLPRALGTDIVPECDRKLARPRCARFLRTAFPDIKVHALGMLAGSIDELRMLRNEGVRSIDSSAPVWRGWCGYPLTSPNWPDYACDFGATFPSDECVGGILSNLQQCGVKTWTQRSELISSESSTPADS